MPIVYKVLGQSAPSATTNTTLYSVPSATSAIVSTITACNRGTAAATYRIAVRIANAAIENNDYLVYDAPLPANATDSLTLGMTLGAADVITVYASSANLSFNAFGSEVS